MLAISSTRTILLTMAYRHATHETYDRFIVQHTEETTTPSGLVVSRHIGLTRMDFLKASQVGELFVSTGVPDIDTSGFLPNPTASFETPTMQDAVEPIV